MISSEECHKASGSQISWVLIILVFWTLLVPIKEVQARLICRVIWYLYTKFGSERAHRNSVYAYIRRYPEWW